MRSIDSTRNSINLASNGSGQMAVHRYRFPIAPTLHWSRRSNALFSQRLTTRSPRSIITRRLIEYRLRALYDRAPAAPHSHFVVRWLTDWFSLTRSLRESEWNCSHISPHRAGFPYPHHMPLGPIPDITTHTRVRSDAHTRAWKRCACVRRVSMHRVPMHASVSLYVLYPRACPCVYFTHARLCTCGKSRCRSFRRKPRFRMKKITISEICLKWITWRANWTFDFVLKVMGFL